MKWTRVVLLLGVLTWGSAESGEKNTGAAKPGISLLSLVFPGYEEPDTNFPDSGNPRESEEPDINWNETLDYLLSLTNDTLSKGRDEEGVVRLRDVNEEFARTIGPLDLVGEFKGTLGYLKGLASLQRKGEVSVTRDGSTFTMTCPVELSEVVMHYGKFSIAVSGGPTLDGGIEFDIGENTVQVNASIEVTDSACAVRLEGVSITELKEFKVKVHGLKPPFDEFLDIIPPIWLTEAFQEDVERILEWFLTRELTNGLQSAKCKKYKNYFTFIDTKRST